VNKKRLRGTEEDCSLVGAGISYIWVYRELQFSCSVRHKFRTRKFNCYFFLLYHSYYRFFNIILFSSILLTLSFLLVSLFSGSVYSLLDFRCVPLPPFAVCCDFLKVVHCIVRFAQQYAMNQLHSSTYIFVFLVLFIHCILGFAVCYDFLNECSG